MDFVIGVVFTDRGFTLQTKAIVAFEKLLHKELETKFHSEVIESWEVQLVCLMDNFRKFFKAKRPKYYVDKMLKVPNSITPYVRMYKCLTMDFEVDFDSFVKLQTEEACLKMLAQEFMQCIETMTYPVVLRKTFDRKAFEQCVRDILTEHGLL